jgi:hypothetical protein
LLLINFISYKTSGGYKSGNDTNGSGLGFRRFYSICGDVGCLAFPIAQETRSRRRVNLSQSLAEVQGGGLQTSSTLLF